MSDIEYSIFYKKNFLDYPTQLAEIKYDLLISAFNSSERVTKIFDSVNADSKHWLVLPEYVYENNEIPDGENVFTFDSSFTESEIIINYFAKNGIEKLNEKRICVDLTGFIRPHLVFLVVYLKFLGIKKVDFLYTDPIKYTKKEETSFSNNCVSKRQINGCEGSHNPNTSNDFLIIGAGYDYQRISDIAKEKNNTTKIHLFGFPSLQADMYQENILKASNAMENSASKGDSSFLQEDYVILAPANDPFITAQQIKEFVEKQHKKKEITNLYLSPLSTKAQTLGFALYFIFEGQDIPTSIIFPFSSKYNRETTEGISKVWIYSVELDLP
jgi:hypothetical protein